MDETWPPRFAGLGGSDRRLRKQVDSLSVEAGFIAMTVWHKGEGKDCFLDHLITWHTHPSCYPLSDLEKRFLIKWISEIPTENHVQDSRHSIHCFCWAPPRWLSIWLFLGPLKLPYEWLTGVISPYLQVFFSTFLTGFWAHLVRDDGKVEGLSWQIETEPLWSWVFTPWLVPGREPMGLDPKSRSIFWGEAMNGATPRNSMC